MSPVSNSASSPSGGDVPKEPGIEVETLPPDVVHENVQRVLLGPIMMMIGRPIEWIYRLTLYMAKTADLEKTSKLINVCLQVCLIALLLYGVTWVNQHSGTDAPPWEILMISDAELVPKAYPISPPDLPDLEENSLMDSVLEFIGGVLPSRGSLER